MLNFVEDFGLASTLEGHTAREHVVEADAQTPDVAFFAVAAREHLGSNVVRGASNPHLGLSLVLNNRKAEINKFHFIVGVQHDIFWFYIPMDYVLRVAMLHRAHQFYHVFGDNFFVNVIFFFDFCENVTAGTQLHAKVNKLMIIIGFKILDYVGMINMIHNCYLSLQPNQILG